MPYKANFMLLKSKMQIEEEKDIPAATYFPNEFPHQYHQPWRA